jgi:hypothetical protein
VEGRGRRVTGATAISHVVHNPSTYSLHTVHYCSTCNTIVYLLSHTEVCRGILILPNTGYIIHTLHRLILPHSCIVV